MLNTSKYPMFFVTVTWLMLWGGVMAADAKTIFTENFEDGNFDSRSWYDNTNLALTSIEKIPNSSKSVEFRFIKGGTTPTSGGAIRKKFVETDTIYVSYWVKYSANWTGSNRNYHPHEFLVLTNKNGDYDGLAFTHLTAYIEQNEGMPLLCIQDGQNINVSNINNDLTNITENRAIAGCNGDSDGFGNGSCYSVGGGEYWNGKAWKADKIYFSDSPGIFYKNDWHFIEAYIKLNSISGGKAVKDGVLKYWYDGNLIINYNNVVLRTAMYSDMKFNQFIIAPWIGDGSPIDQTFWIDDLTVATERPENSQGPTPPINLRVINN